MLVWFHLLEKAVLVLFCVCNLLLLRVVSLFSALFSAIGVDVGCILKEVKTGLNLLF